MMLKNFVEHCIHCKIAASSYQVNTTIGKLPRAFVPFQIWHLDIFEFAKESDKFKYVLTMKDDFTHLIKFEPLIKADAISVAKALSNLWAFTGCPELVCMDCGTHFKNQIVNNLMTRHGVLTRFSMPYVHRSNGKVERVHGQLIRLWRSLKSELRWNEKDWIFAINLLQSILNSTPITRCDGKCPIEMLTGSPVRTPLQTMFIGKAIYNLDDLPKDNAISQAAEEFTNSLFNLSTTSISVRESNKFEKFAVGDWVLLSNPVITSKGDFRWNGPYVIYKILSPHVIEIENIKGNARQIVHANRLKFYSESEYGKTHKMSLEEQQVWSYLDLSLQSILDVYQKQDNKLYFEVSWSSQEYSYKQEVLAQDLFFLYPSQSMKFIQGIVRQNHTSSHRFKCAETLLDSWTDESLPLRKGVLSEARDSTR